jgi:hypothetical protein
MPSKTCTGCKETKDTSLFVADHRLKSGIGSKCKTCVAVINKRNRDVRGVTGAERNTIYRKKYGITLEQYEQMLIEQDSKCAVCGKTEQENTKRLAVDHCHKTGRVRKLLCHHCNCALGMVDDDRNKLVALISYLMENE